MLADRYGWTAAALVGIVGAVTALASRRASDPPAPRLDCPTPVVDANPLLVPGATLVFGEVHGTTQIPAAFGAIACRAAERGPIVVGLEMPWPDQPILDAYLTSDGGAAARAALFEGLSWGAHDGRSSEAMLALVDQLRVWRARGAAVTAVAFDVVLNDGDGTNEREAGMVGPLLAARTAQPGAALLVLTGNLHARLAGSAQLPGVAWMAERLARVVPGVATFDAAYGRGTAWVCVGDFDDLDCGEREWGHGEDPGPTRITYDPVIERDALVYHGHLHVGAIEASRPAKP